MHVKVIANLPSVYTQPLPYTCARTQDFPSFLLLVHLRLRLSLALSAPSSMRQNKTNPEHFHISPLHCFSAGERKFLQNPFIDDQTHGLTSFLLFVIFISLQFRALWKKFSIQHFSTHNSGEKESCGIIRIISFN